MYRSAFLVLCVIFLLAGCSSKDPVAKARQAFAEEFVAAIQKRNVLSIESMLSDEFSKPENRSTIRTTVSMFPRTPAKPPVLVDLDRRQIEGREFTRYVYRLDYTDSDTTYYLLVSVGDETHTFYRGKFYEVIGVYIFPRLVSDMQANEFHLAKLRVGQVVMLVLAAASLLIAGVGFIACLTSSLNWRPKVLSLLAILIGYPQISYNWLNGLLHINLLGLQVPMVAAYRMEPWLDVVVSVGLPVAALVYWRQYPADIKRVFTFIVSVPVRFRAALGR